MSYIQLNIPVHAEDLPSFLELLSNYHKDPKILGELLLTSRKDQTDKPCTAFGENPTEPTTLFAHISQNCTCGTCYGKFAAPDRIPWRSNGDGIFVNAKHGIREIAKGCDARSFHGLGYIYQTRAELEFETKRELKKSEAIAAKQKLEDDKEDRTRRFEERKEKKKSEAIAAAAAHQVLEDEYKVAVSEGRTRDARKMNTARTTAKWKSQASNNKFAREMTPKKDTNRNTVSRPRRTRTAEECQAEMQQSMIQDHNEWKKKDTMMAKLRDDPDLGF
jgi:hypothetical protein